MVDESHMGASQDLPPQVGARLRAEREAQGLELADIAQRTRIPQRHLEAIEASNYSALPSTTYAMGFARAYARAIGADEVALARDLRGELATGWQPPVRPDRYDPSDPARVPPRGLALGGVALFVLILIGIGIWYGAGNWSGREATAPAPKVATVPGVPGAAIPPTPQPAPTPATGPGQVVLTASGEVWVRIYDGANQTLAIRTMQPGERFEVPQDADRPMINVGRPDQLVVTIDGQQVAPLGGPERAIKDVGISADALRARTATAPSAG
ncbi:RodZ domain-containing protein [Sphingomonas sp.]